MFNHKGGVSKTTTTFNLGWSIAGMEKKVLLVDADPQSNLTSLALSIPDEDAFASLYSRKDSNDIKTLADNVYSGARVIERPQANIVSTAQPNLFILPGHLEIEDFNTTITTALQVGVSPVFAQMRNIPGYLNYALRRIADIHALDYIIIDMAPSLGGLNEVLLMGSDFFIAPCAPDFFSAIALTNIAKIIPKWYEQIKNFQSDYPLPCQPKFLGIIEQKYRPRRISKDDSKNKPAKEFNKWIDNIRAITNSELVPTLQKLNLTISADDFKRVISDLQPFDLALISDFNSLIAISQRLNKPIFTLSVSEIKQQGKVLQTQLDNVEKFKETFAKLADNIVKLTS
jgi:cellulose biosynthesis protein BcsQ